MKYDFIRGELKMKRNYLRNNLLFFQLINNIKPRQKQLIISCCVVLAAMITIVTIPILAGHASGENNISDCDIVTKSDIANATESSKCNSKSICSVKTIEPKRTQTSATEQGITYSIEDSVLTISGTGSVTVKNINHLFPQTDVANIRTVTINEGITDIADYSFQFFGQITSINLPESLTSIGKGAFYSCTGLTSITLPAQISEISEAAFLNCSSLNSISFKGNITSIGFVAFSECTSLNSFTVPSTISNIGSRVFQNCTNLKTVVFECSSLTHTDLKNLISESTKKVVLPCNFMIDGHTPRSGELEWYIGDTVTTIESSHKWDEGSILSSAATCLEQGEIQYTCQFDSTHTKKEYFTGNHSITHHEAAAATCTENGNSEHWKCDVCGKCFSDADAQTEITEASTVVSSLGHDWHPWKDVEGQPGMVWRDCVVCGTVETEIHPLLQFVVAAGNGQTYTKGSQQPLTVKFDKKDWPDLRRVNVYEMFTQNGGTIDVTAPDGTVTPLGAGDFSASEGSLYVTLSASYLEGMEDGDYTMTVTFVVAPGYEKTSAPSSFTVVSPAPAGSDSPATVESIALVVLSNILTKSSSCSSPERRSFIMEVLP